MSIIGDGIMLGAGGESASIFVTGLSETDNVSATHKIPEKVPNPAYVVPDGYTQLEYIQNTGTQYIDTGIFLNPLNGFEIDCKFSTLSSGVRQLMFGNYRNGNEESINVEITTADALRYYAMGNIGSYSKVSTGEIYNVHVEYNNSTKLLSFSSELGSASATKSYTEAFTSKMRLFLDNRDNPTTTFGSEKIRIYQYSVSVGGTYIQNLIPCKRNSDNTIGMYDLVSGTFYTNAGTGTFVAGAEIPQYIDEYVDGKTIVGKWTQKPNPAIVVPSGYTQLEYIQSTGTQYIDTGFYANQDTSLYIKGKVLNVPDEIVGGETNYNVNAFHLYIDGDKYDIGFGSNQSKFVSASVGDEFELTLDNKGVNLKVNGQEYTDTFSSQNSFTSPYSTVLFANRRSATSCGITQINAFTLKVNDNVVQNLVPCKRNSDGAIGMYDLVTNSFFENAGTGIFTAGAEIPQTFDGFLIDKIKDYGTWTVTATNGTNTATHDVLVDSAMQYDIELSYKLWLYQDGDECEAVTGGWTHDGYGSFNSITTLSGTKATSYFDLGSKSTTELYALGTKNKINLTGYSTLYCEYSTNDKDTPSIILTAIQSPLSWPDVLFYLTPSTTGTGNNKIMSISLSSSKELYVMVANLIQRTSATTARIHKIWLE